LRAIPDQRIRTGCSSPRVAAESLARTPRVGRAAAICVLALLAIALGRDNGPRRFTLEYAGFDQLSGWADDPVSAAVPAFLKSCARFLARPDTAPLDSTAMDADFGRAGEWRSLCRSAEALPAADDTAARRFFETGFAPLAVSDYGNAEGLFTGYFEIELHGSRRRHGRYQTPIYRKPPDLGSKPLPTRAEIEDGALADRGLELLWVDDPIDVFFLQIQGSGRVRLQGGESVRVGYDGQNGHSYVPVGRLLLERRLIPRERLTMTSIRSWMREFPAAGAALRRENPSYVFFREIRGDGPIGSEGVALTPERSLAVDRTFIALGIPLWLEAEERFAQLGGLRRLVIAQDTGGAIKGPVRGDLFWGTGTGAGSRAGAMNAAGRYYVLLPRAVAARLAPGRAPTSAAD
jgi:membrane-bound lytic murein transglycosylase A